MAIAASVSALALISTSVLLTDTFATTGLFFKAFDKTLSPGENYEKNITVRQYYNLTVRFQKDTVTTTYLTFDSNDTSVILKNLAGEELARQTGVLGAKMYFLLSKPTLDSIETVSAYNIVGFSDVQDQPVTITYSGTNAYLTVKVHYASASISGKVIDELTGSSLQGINVTAFDDGADTTTASIINSSLTDSNGNYAMQFSLNTSKALDVYVQNYEVS